MVRKGSPLYLAQNVAHRGAQSDLLNKFTLIAINPPLLWGKYYEEFSVGDVDPLVILGFSR